MATLPTLIPTSDAVGSFGGFTDNAGGTTNLYTKVDETIAGAVDTNDYIQGGALANVGFLFTDMPADFVSMSSLSIQLRYAESGRVDDTVAITARVFDPTAGGLTTMAGATSGPLTPSKQTIVVSATSTAFANSSVVAFVYLDTTANKASWDGARIELDVVITTTKGADGAVAKISAVELTGTYTASAAEDPVPRFSHVTLQAVNTASRW